jgi:hypothetical protein
MSPSQVRGFHVDYRDLAHATEAAFDDFESPSVEKLRRKGSRETSRSLEARRRVAGQVGGIRKRRNKHGI